MKKKINELMLEAGYAAPEIAERAQKFADLLIAECIDAVQSTGKQCAFTTYDLGVVECTIKKSVDAIKERFQDDTQ